MQVGLSTYDLFVFQSRILTSENGILASENQDFASDI